MNALLRWIAPRAAGPIELPVSSVVRSHVGRVREINEDRVLERPEVGLWAVADGMGGHSGGGEAADILVAHLARLAAPIPARRIDAALAAAHAAILDAGGGRSGTTAVVLLVDGGRADIFWAGDSRAYLVRGGTLQLLTRDHSVVQELVDAGTLTPEQAVGHPRANVITNALGVGDALKLDHARHGLRPGDRILLCSDGLSRSLCDRDVRSREPLDALADRLLTNALQRDGSDNITFAMIEFA